MLLTTPLLNTAPSNLISIRESMRSWRDSPACLSSVVQCLNVSQWVKYPDLDASIRKDIAEGNISLLSHRCELLWLYIETYVRPTIFPQIVTSCLTDLNKLFHMNCVADLLCGYYFRIIVLLCVGILFVLLIIARLLIWIWVALAGWYILDLVDDFILFIGLFQVII